MLVSATCRGWIHKWDNVLMIHMAGRHLVQKYRPRMRGAIENLGKHTRVLTSMVNVAIVTADQLLTRTRVVLS